MIDQTKIPKEWTWKKLGDISDIIGGFARPKDEKSYENGSIPFVRMRDLGRYHLTANLSKTESLLNENFVKNNNLRIIKKGSILLPRSGSVALNHRAVLGMDACIVSHICALQVKDPDVFNLYLYYALRQIDMKKYLKKTTGLDLITFQDLSKIKVPFPPMETQKSICSILEKTEQLQQLRVESDKLTNDFLDSVFHQMFGDPVSNPKNIRKVKLVEVCTKITDGTHIKPSYAESGIPFLSAKNVHKDFLDTKDVKYVSEKDHKKLTARSKPEKHDILYRKVGAGYGVARAIDVEMEMSIFVSLALIKPNHSVINWKFLETMLNSNYVKAQARKRIKGIAVPDLHLEEIRDFQIFLPSSDEQRQFSVIVERLEMLKSHQSKSSCEISSLFQSLVLKAFKGEKVC